LGRSLSRAVMQLASSPCAINVPSTSPAALPQGEKAPPAIPTAIPTCFSPRLLAKWRPLAKSRRPPAEWR
jgi:hypothetical protein